MRIVKYPIIEINFTIQGEGKFSGSPAIFIRLAGCPIECIWCDTQYSWDASSYPNLLPHEIVQKCTKILSKGINGLPQNTIIVITGGEPTFYDLSPLTSELKKLKMPIHLETSGAYPIRGTFNWITISPKPHLTKYTVNQRLINNLKIAQELKIVIYDVPKDIQWAEECKKYASPNTYLCLQPEWSLIHKNFPYILNHAIKHPEWHLSLQLHKFFNLP